MNTDVNINFNAQYKTLGLEKTADWDSVQRAYRKLVNKWHPDRHQGSPDAAAEAEQHFILITRAFNILRDFNRENNRLPLQAAKEKARGPQESKKSKGVVYDDEELAYGSYTHGVAPEVSDEEIIGSSILSSSSNNSPIKKQSDSKTIKSNRYFMGGLTLFAMLMVTVALMFQLDRYNSEKAKREASAALRAEKPSKFLRSAQEIQRTSGTGAFLEATPQSSALGNQIRGDTFSK